MFRRHQLLAVALLSFATAALSSGCSEDEQSTPRVTFDSEVAPGSNPAKECPQTGTWLTVGNFGNPARGRTNPADPESPLVEPVRPVDDGADEQQGKVSLNCSVRESGDGFDVAASVELTGATGGAVTVTGRFTLQGDQANITLSLSRRGQTYRATDCVARYDTVAGHGVAAGRVWASITCAKAEDRSSQTNCQTLAQIRLENCAQ